MNRELTEKERELIELLCDWFEITPEDTPEETLKSYGFTSGAYLGYGWPRLSLGEVVKAIRNSWILDNNQ